MKIFLAILLLANVNQFSDRQKVPPQEPPPQITNAPQVNCHRTDSMCFIATAQRLAEKGEQLDLALACVRWALAIPPRPNDAVPRQGFFVPLAYVHIKRREFGQALAILLQGAKRSPDYAGGDHYLTYLALAYEGLGRIDEAIDTYISLAGGLREVSAAPTEKLVELYRKRFGSLAGLQEKIEANRLKTNRVVYVERELLNIPAPDWSLRDLNGRQVSLADFSGRILVLSFMSAGGNIHEEALKYLQAQYEKYKDKGIAFVCIEFTGYPHIEEFKTNLQRMGVTLPLLIDDSQVTKRYIPALEPTIVLIDEKGTIRFKNTIYFEYRTPVTKQLDYLLETKLK